MSSVWKTAYRACDKRLTCSDLQTDVVLGNGLDFQGAATGRSCPSFRHGTAQCSNENEEPPED